MDSFLDGKEDSEDNDIDILVLYSDETREGREALIKKIFGWWGGLSF